MLSLLHPGSILISRQGCRSPLVCEPSPVVACLRFLINSNIWRLRDVYPPNIPSAFFPSYIIRSDLFSVSHPVLKINVPLFQVCTSCWASHHNECGYIMIILPWLLASFSSLYVLQPLLLFGILGTQPLRGQPRLATKHLIQNPCLDFSCMNYFWTSVCWVSILGLHLVVWWSHLDEYSGICPSVQAVVDSSRTFLRLQCGIHHEREVTFCYIFRARILPGARSVYFLCWNKEGENLPVDISSRKVLFVAVDLPQWCVITYSLGLNHFFLLEISPFLWHWNLH